MPPSAIMGIPYFSDSRAHSKIAETWGTPAPEIILVEQVAPGPMPTLIASTPIMGIPYFSDSRAHSKIAETWGTPAPEIILVEQVAPGPMPTLIASTPI